MAISFGPGGNSESWAKRKFPQDLPEYLASMGLNGYEIECGRGVRIAQKTYDELPGLAEKHGITISLHTPYYISLSSENEETRIKSVGYILESARAAKKTGAKKIVIHSGSCAKISRELALQYAKDTLYKSIYQMDKEDLGDIILCPETMGKMNQLGTVEEVIELCRLDDRMLPCVDFGHLNARTLGSIKTISDYENILDKIEDGLGFERLNNMHVHFSKIEYTAGGEKRHLTFEDTDFGPNFEPLMELFAKRKLNPSIICESAGTQAEDAAEMKKTYEKYL